MVLDSQEVNQGVISVTQDMEQTIPTGANVVGLNTVGALSPHGLFTWAQGYILVRIHLTRTCLGF